MFTVAEIDAYSISVFLHVSAVVIGFGSTAALALAFPLAMRSGTRHLPFLHDLSLGINQRMVAPAMVVILATGFYQTADGDWGFGSFWISATFAIVIVLGGITGAYFIPTDRKLAAMARAEIDAGDETPSAEYQRLAQREGSIGGLAGLLILAAVFLMITKPGA